MQGREEKKNKAKIEEETNSRKACTLHFWRVASESVNGAWRPNIAAVNGEGNSRQFLMNQCNAQMMARTRGGKALYMHCLPGDYEWVSFSLRSCSHHHLLADISGVSCTAGEVSKSVFEENRDDTYQEASYKPYVIAAMILAAKFENLPGFFDAIVKRNTSRVLKI